MRYVSKVRSYENHISHDCLSFLRQLPVQHFLHSTNNCIWFMYILMAWLYQSHKCILVSVKVVFLENKFTGEIYRVWHGLLYLACFPAL